MSQSYCKVLYMLKSTSGCRTKKVASSPGNPAMMAGYTAGWSDYDGLGSQAAFDRLLRAGLWRDGRYRVAGHHGRSAAARWVARRDSWIRRGRPDVAAHRLCLWPVGEGDSRLGRRGGLHRQVLFTGH